jgi:hypothetical protein
MARFCVLIVMLIGKKGERVDEQTVVDTMVDDEGVPFYDEYTEHKYYHKLWSMCCNKRLHEKEESNANTRFVVAVGSMFD